MSLADVINKIKADREKDRLLLSSPSEIGKQTVKDVGFQKVSSSRDLDNQTQAPTPAKNYNIFDEIKNTVMRIPGQAGSQVLDMAGYLTRDPAFSQGSQILAEKTRRDYPTNAPQISSMSDLESASISDIAKYALAESGQVVSSLASMAIPGSIISKGAIPALNTIAKYSPKVANLIKYVGGAEKAAEYISAWGGGSLLEAGSIASDAYDKTGEMPERLKVLPWALGAGALEALEPIRLLGRFAARVPAGIAEEAAKKTGKSLIAHIVNYAKDMGLEGGTEFLQTLIEESGVKNIQGTPAVESIISTAEDPDARARGYAAGIAGFAGGAVAGGPGFVGDVMTNNKQVPAEPTGKKKVDLVKEKLIQQEQAEKPTVQQDLGVTDQQPEIVREADELRKAMDSARSAFDKPTELYEADKLREAMDKARGVVAGAKPQAADIGINSSPVEAQNDKLVKQVLNVLDAIGVKGNDVDAISMSTFNKPFNQLNTEELSKLYDISTTQAAMGNTVGSEATTPEVSPVGLAGQQPAPVPTMQPVAATPPEMSLPDRISLAKQEAAQRATQAPQMQQPGRMEMPQTQEVTRPITPEDIQPFADQPEPAMEPEQKKESDVDRLKKLKRQAEIEYSNQGMVKNYNTRKKIEQYDQAIALAEIEEGIEPLMEADVGDGKRTIGMYKLPDGRYAVAAKFKNTGEFERAEIHERLQAEQILNSFKAVEAPTETKPEPKPEPAKKSPAIAAIEQYEVMSDQMGISQTNTKAYKARLKKARVALRKVLGETENQLDQMITLADTFEKLKELVSRIESGKVAPAPEAKPTPRDGWKENIIKAREYAGKLGIDTSGTNDIKKIISMVEFAEAAGKTTAPETKSDYGAKNTITSKEKYEAAKARLKAGLKTVKSGIDPTLMPDAIIVGMYHVEAGIRKFADFAKAMIEDIGEGVRPYLKSAYASAKNDPQLEEFYDEFDSEESVRQQFKDMAKPEETTPDLGKPGEINIPALSDALVPTVESLLTMDKPMTNPQLEKVLADLGIDTKDSQYNHKITQEAFEGALVKVIREKKLQGKFDELLKLYENQPNLSVRTAGSVSGQAYSTPVPLVGALTEAIGPIKSDAIIYEPTAGNGLLVSSIKTKDGNNLYLNELDDTRNEVLSNIFPEAEITNKDATEFSPPINADVVLANPPFGSTPEVMIKTEGEKVIEIPLTKIDHVIAHKALQNMKDNGRAVLIMGAQKTEEITGTNASFLRYLYNQFNITGHFELSGDLYKRQGAAWPVMVVTIEGKKSFPKQFIQAPDKVRRAVNWNEVKQLAGEIKPGIYINGKLDNTKQQSTDGLRGNEAQTPTTPEASSKTDTKTEGRPSGTTKSGSTSTGLATGKQPTGDSRLDTGKGRDTRGDNAELAERIKQVKRPAAERTDRPGDDDSGVVETELQVKYDKKAESDSINSLIPVNLKNPTEQALNDLIDSVEEKTLDDYVAHQLGLKDKSEMVNDEGRNWFSGEQIDALASIFRNFLNKAGTIVADQTGLGKGRTAAGAIRWANANGKIPYFATEGVDLFNDLYRDITDIGGNNLRPFIMPSEGAIYRDGKLITKYSEKLYKQVIARMKKGDYSDFIGPKRKFDYILGTHLNTTYVNKNTGLAERHSALMNAPDDSLVMIMDEAHNAANPASNIFDKSMSLLEDKRSNAVLYLSATWAKRPDQMTLYHRAFGRQGLNIDEINTAISKGGVAVQEMLVANMARAGSYIRREQSYNGVTFDRKITEDAKESLKEVELADNVMENVTDIINIEDKIAIAVERLDIEGLVPERFRGAKIKGGYVGKSLTTPTSPFSQVHNYISSFLTSLKAKQAADYAIELIKQGVKPVIVVQNTMGSQLETLLNRGDVKLDGPFSATFADNLELVLDKARMITVTNPFNKKDQVTITIPLEMLPPGIREMDREIREQIRETDFGDMPFSFIDYIKNEVSKAGYSMGEITGRSKIIDYVDTVDGQPTVRVRPPEETSVEGKQKTIAAFNDGSVDAMIFNVAGATGMSLHSSVKFKDQRKREMIVLQPFLDINKFMQALGRIHRVGEIVNEKDVTSRIEGKPATYGYPSYKYLQSSLSMEKRPGIHIENKMKSLNANTSSNAKGHQKVADIDVMNKYGMEVMLEWLAARPLVNAQLGFTKKKATDPSQITGRLAILPNEIQEEFWTDITREYQEKIDALDAKGENELKIRTYKDANAKTLKKTLIFGKEGDAQYPAIYKEVVDMKITGNPTTLEQAKNRVEESKIKPKMQEANDIFDKYVEQKKAEKAEREASGQQSGISIPGMTSFKDSVVEQIMKLEPGSLVVNPEGFYGIITNVDFYQLAEGKNPFAPGNIKITMAAPNAGGAMIISLSGFRKYNYSKHTGDKNNIPAVFARGYNESYEKNKTQIVRVDLVTGDMIRAAGMVNNADAIQFQREDGGLDFAWMLLIKDDIIKNPTLPLTNLDMKESNPAFIKSGDNGIIIGTYYKQPNGMLIPSINKNVIQIRIAKSAKYSTKLATDEELNSMLSRGPQDAVFEIDKIPGKGAKQYYTTAILPVSKDQRTKILIRMNELAKSAGTTLTSDEVSMNLKSEAVSQQPSGRSGRAGILEIFTEWADRKASDLLESAYNFISRGSGSFLEWLKTVSAKVRNLAAKAWKDAQKLVKAAADISGRGGLGRRGGIVSLRELQRTFQEAVAEVPAEKITPAVTEEIAVTAAQAGYDVAMEGAKKTAKKVAATAKKRADKKVGKVKEKLAGFKKKKSLEFADRKYLVELSSKIPVKDRGALVKGIAEATTPLKVKKVISRIEKLYNRVVNRKAMKRFKAAISAARKLRPEFQAIADDIRANPIDAVNGLIKYIGEDDTLLIPDELLTALNTLKENKPKDLSTKTIDMISQALETIKHLSDSENKRIFAENTRTLKESVDDIKTHVEAQKKIEEGEGLSEGVRRFMNNGSMQFEAITEELGETGRKLFYEDLREGERITKEVWFEGRDVLHDAMRKVGLDPESNATNEWLEEEVEVGDSKMTRGEYLNLIANLKDSSTRKEVLRAGIRLKNKDAPIIRLDDAEIDAIVNSMSKKESAVVDTMRSFLNNQLKEQVNSVWVDLAGFAKALKDDYWPRTRDIKKVGVNKGYRQWAKTALEELGIFKERETSKSPVVIKDIMSVYQNHLKKSSSFIGLAKPIRNIEMALGKGGLSDMIEKQYGKKFVERIEEQIQALADLGTPGGGELDTWFRRLLKNISIGFLGFNPRSAFKQFGGLATAATEIDFGMLASSIGKSFNKDTEKEMFEYSAILRDRYDSTGAKLVSPTFDTGRKIAGLTNREIRENKAMWMLETFDKAVSQIIWEAAKLEISQKNPKLKGDAFMKAVARRTEQVVSRTQNVTSILDMSGVAIEGRKNAMLKGLTMFQSQGNSIYNILRRNIKDYRSGKIKLRTLGKNLVFATLGNAMWSSMVGNLLSASLLVSLVRGGGKEDEEEIKKAFSSSEIAFDVLRENVQMMYGGSLASSFMFAAKREIESGGKTFGTSGAKLENVTESVLNKTMQGSLDIMKGILQKGEKFKSGPRKGKGKLDENLKRGSLKLIKGLIPLTGLPYSFTFSEGEKLLSKLYSK